MWIKTKKDFFLALVVLAIATVLLLQKEPLERYVSNALERTISSVFTLSPMKQGKDDKLNKIYESSDSFVCSFDLEVERIWQGVPVIVKTSGSCQQVEGSWHLAIDSCSGVLDTLSFSLLEPVYISTKAGQVTLPSFSLKIGEGLLQGSLTHDENAIQALFKGDNLSLASLPLQSIALPLGGLLSFEGSVTGSLSSPKVDLYVSATNIHPENEAFSKLLPRNGKFSVSLDDGFLNARGQMTATETTPIYFDVQMPVEFSLQPFGLRIDPEAPLRGSIAAEAEIAPLLYATLQTPTTFSGHAKASLSLMGTYSQPQFEGTCELANGSYEIPEIGVFLTGLSAQIDVRNSELQIKNVIASDGQQGSVTGSGYVFLNPAQHYPFLLDLKLENAAALNQDYIQVISNGSLTLKGNLQEGALGGNLEASQASVTIPDHSNSTINTVDVTYVNIPEEIAQPQSIRSQEGPAWPLNLDIHLEIPRSLSITGRDLSSDWKGALHIHGTASKPLVTGEVKITEGEYLFNGNPFQINQGTLTFAGDLDKKITLYVIASRDLDKVKVDVIAKGPVRNPEISFRSNPPLPQREILSWILFNRGTSEISPFQGAQLSESITNLSTHQQGPDVLSKIRSTLGIDRFEICRSPNNDNNNVNVQIGKYISDNFLISVIKSDVNRIAIEATLTDRIKLQAHVGEDSQGQLLLKWKRDY